MTFMLAAKCAPDEKILNDINKAGIEAVELYSSKKILQNLDEIIKICRKFSFKYAIHAPNDGYNPEILSQFVKEINASVVVYHDILWEDEWKQLIEIFSKIDAKIHIENLGSISDPSKFIRRYGLGRCLDLEHMQFEVGGVFEEEFISVIKESSHIHLTGYIAGSDLWHTHINRSKKHGMYMFDLLKKANYSGMVVSEARKSFQKYEDFKKLNNFYRMWKAKN